MNVDSHQCLECTGVMHEIKLIDRGHGVSYAGVDYTHPDAKVSFWGKLPVAGNVKSFMCEACGRIALYGVAAE
jgi:hypothetical protein